MGDATCLKLLAGMGTAVLGLATAVVVLFRALMKSQSARLLETREHRDTIRSLYEMMARRKR